MTGPITAYLAGEMRAQRGWLVGMTVAKLAQKSGVSLATTKRALAGESALAIEAFVPLSVALGLDPGVLLDQADLAVNGPRIPTATQSDVTIAAKRGLSRAEQRRRIVGDEDEGA